MKIYSLFFSFINILLSFPINYISNNLYNDSIEICVDIDGSFRFDKTYYSNGAYMDYEEGYNYYDLKKGESISFNINKKYDSVSLEIYTLRSFVGEVKIDIPKKKEKEEFIVTVKDESIFELIDIKYVFNKDGSIKEKIEIGNTYKFNKDNSFLPKIIELDKLSINCDKQKYKDYNDCYLLLNNGLMGSDFDKSKEDFYKVPLNCKIKDNTLFFELKEEYYYDFNKGVMKNKKTNNCVKVNDLILSKNDNLLTEAYLVIEDFGFSNKLQLDLLLEEKPLFGKNGYYEIKRVN